MGAATRGHGLGHVIASNDHACTSSAAVVLLTWQWAMRCADGMDAHEREGATATANRAADGSRTRKALSIAGNNVGQEHAALQSCHRVGTFAC